MMLAARNAKGANKANIFFNTITILRYLRISRQKMSLFLLLHTHDLIYELLLFHLLLTHIFCQR